MAAGSLAEEAEVWRAGKLGEADCGSAGAVGREPERVPDWERLGYTPGVFAKSAEAIEK
jgi:hypothetical protein